jgi:hypothetical protein
MSWQSFGQWKLQRSTWNAAVQPGPAREASATAPFGNRFDDDYALDARAAMMKRRR